MKGGGLIPLGLSIAALSPIALAGWLGAEWTRARLARPDRVRATLRELGIDVAGKRIDCRRLGQGEMNAVFLVTITGHGESHKLVLKHTLRFGTLLGWVVREVGAMREYPRSLGRRARFAREVAALRELAPAGVAVPRCLGASTRSHAMAMEWIDGRALAFELGRRPALASELGRLLAQLHARDLAMGDANPRNVAVTASGRLVAFDFEVSHARASEPQKGFDLAWASAFLPSDAARDELFAAYGPRSAALDAAIAGARAHLARFWPLVDFYAWRWRRADAGRPV
ncbi:MAG TPA: lipopolysaccharide kinase InaA family protein [Kofleriaceae bacterium]|nr:lipopolysaccharide kinase InaA family protein [Kofleriaceae bacterium]